MEIPAGHLPWKINTPLPENIPQQIRPQKTLPGIFSVKN